LASQLRFEGRELESLLERVRKEVGVDAHIVAANRIRKGGIGGFFAKEGFEVVVETKEPRMRPQASRAPVSVLDLADEVSESEREQIIDLSELLSEPPPLSTERPDFGSILAEISRTLDREDEEMPMPTVQTTRIEIEEPAPPVSPRSHYRRVVADPPPAQPALPAGPDERLVALGLPLELVPSRAANAELRTALWQRLSQLPPPPMLPRSAGVLIAVVGIGTAPIALARKLADEIDLDPEHIVLSTPEPVSELSHPDEAEAFRLACRRRAEPTIVACSIGAGRAQLAWAHRMLDRLEPTITWAVVDASCKAEDIGHRVGLLGGVDVLALTGIADTVSPAAVLQLNIPVGRLGPTPATPAAWADLLMERLDRER
jgi:hypothetical protein